MIAGYSVIRDAVSQRLLRALQDRFSEPSQERRGGLRNALDIAEVSSTVHALRPWAARAIGGAEAHVRCVRGIVFDKTPAANWKVAWHQDRSIAVRQPAELPGFGPWSTKDGVVHVEPPLPILQRIVTLRLHLDDCTDENGPLRVIPASHKGGILSDQQIALLGCGAAGAAVELTCRAGDAIAMRPLLLHASSKAKVPYRRRVVHLEFSQDVLPLPLEWRWCV